MGFIEIPILESAAKCGIRFNTQALRIEVEADCPFCGDTKKHLSLNMSRNVFRCNRCNESGNSISLYAKFYNIDNKTAYKELTDNSDSENDYIPEYQPPTAAKQPDIKPLADRHNVYYDMLQSLELSTLHRRQLLNRGLDNERIERNMYRTVPKAYSKQYNALMHKLTGQYDLSGIPGFYLKNGKWQMVIKGGLFIPVCNQYGYIQGLQIRLDDETNRKYRWFSSNYYEKGTKARPWIHTANWNNPKAVYITEGALKAEVTSYLMNDACIIAVAGVNCVRGLSGLLKELGVSEVIETLDMDKLTNPNVAKALAAIKNIVRQAGIKYSSMTWDSAFKGIDDYCFAMRKKALAA